MARRGAARGAHVDPLVLPAPHRCHLRGHRVCQRHLGYARRRCPELPAILGSRAVSCLSVALARGHPHPARAFITVCFLV